MAAAVFALPMVTGESYLARVIVRTQPSDRRFRQDGNINHHVVDSDVLFFAGQKVVVCRVGKDYSAHALSRAPLVVAVHRLAENREALGLQEATAYQQALQAARAKAIVRVEVPQNLVEELAQKVSTVPAVSNWFARIGAEPDIDHLAKQVFEAVVTPVTYSR